MFNLSTNSTLQVLQSNFNSQKYVKLLRLGNNAEKRERWINFAANTWDAIQSMGSQISAELENFDGDEGSEKTFQVNDQTTININKFKGLLYVGFCQKNGEFTNRINLNMDEWKKLTAELCKIRKCLHVEESKAKKKRAGKALATPSKKKKITSEATSNITKYQWVIIGTDGTVRKNNGKWFFSQDQCVQDGTSELQDDLDILLIDTCTEAILPPLDLLKLVYATVVQETAKQLARSACDGCKTDHPSQSQHMAPGGCLTEDHEKTSHYMKDALAAIGQSQVLDLVNKVYTKLGLPIDVMFVNPVNLPDVTEADLANCFKPHNEDYMELIRESYQS